MHLSSLQTQHQQLILSQQQQQQLNTETNDSYDYLPKYFGDNRPYFHFRYTEQGFCVNQNNVIQNPSNCVLEDRIQKWYLYPTIAGLHPPTQEKNDTMIFMTCHHYYLYRQKIKYQQHQTYHQKLS